MLTYARLVRPETPTEAYELFAKNKMAVFMGGACWLRLGQRNWPTMIDLSGTGLRYIKNEEDAFIIGAMSTQGDVERYEPFQTFAKGMLVQAVQAILGVQFRNCATFGASVAAKFGFSDIIPTLLALEAKVHLCGAGIISLEEYLTHKYRDLLLEVIIPKKEIPAAAEALRKSQSDFPYLTGAVNCVDGKWHIFVGTRPGPAVLAVKASTLLSTKGLDSIDEAAETCADEVFFETNSHATADYRKAMTEGMVKRLVKEVAAWK